MAYTTPMTAGAGAVHSAAEWNAYVRDNFKALSEPRTSWGSGASWTGSTGNPAIGNGTWDARYLQLGKFVSVNYEITMGSSTTFGSGNWQLDLPVPESSDRWMFSGVARDTSAGESYPVWAERAASGLLTVRTTPLVAGNPLRTVTDTIPFAWGNTDVLFLSGTYEAA